MRVAVIEHQADVSAGLLGDWAQDRGVALSTLRPDDLADPPDPRRFDAIAPLGSDRSVHASPDAWIADELRLLREAVAASVPVLGICFGAQALAAALGAPVHRMPRREIGWMTLEAVDVLHAGPWLSWHEDTFELPEGARELARSAACTQAFRHGPHVGLQFHAEATPAIVDGWIATTRGALVEAQVEEDALRAQTRRLAGEAAARAFALFDGVAAGWTRAA